MFALGAIAGWPLKPCTTGCGSARGGPPLRAGVGVRLEGLPQGLAAIGLPRLGPVLDAARLHADSTPCRRR